MEAVSTSMKDAPSSTTARLVAVLDIRRYTVLLVKQFQWLLSPELELLQKLQLAVAQATHNIRIQGTILGTGAEIKSRRMMLLSGSPIGGRAKSKQAEYPGTNSLPPSRE